MRLWWIFLGLAVLVLIPFLIWGEGLEALFSQEGTALWLERYGSWAWLAGVILLSLDLWLPIPGTAVMSGLGLVYGWGIGGMISAGGSICSGLLGYGLCRMLGERVARVLMGEEDRARGERWFHEGGGGWVVAVSRWLPVMPEVVACMAGLLKMPFGRFLAALVCGAVPLGFVFAAVGDAGRSVPVLALALSAGMPPLLWLVIRKWVKT